MARLFSGAVSSDFQISTTFGLSGPPLTYACWFKRTATGTAGYLVSFTSASGIPDSLATGISVSGNFFAEAADWGVVAANGAIASNTTSWVHGVGEFASTTSRTATADGVAGTTNTTSVVPASLARWNVGVLNEQSGIGYAAASVASVAVWNTTLTADEHISLAKGFPPHRVRPQSLIIYIPTIRNVIEWKTRTAFNTSGGTVADHPRTYGYG